MEEEIRSSMRYLILLVFILNFLMIIFLEK